MDALREEKIYTVDDIEALSDGERAELIDGKIYYMSMPGTTHQRILVFLERVIGNYIEANKGKGEIIPAPFAVYINNDKTNYVEPDISIICDLSKLDEKGCHGAPDWIIEIVSSSSRTMDWFIKLIKYSNAGVREYWVVDLESSSIMVYRFENETSVERYRFGEDVPVGIYEGFSVNLTL